MEKKYESKAVVSGISQGGDIAFLMAVYYPKLCKASFPFAGYIHSQLYNDIMRKPLNNVPVYLFQGEDDPIVPVFYSKEAVKKLDKKLALKLFTYPGVGHEISAKMKMDYSTMIDKINLQ
jgi:predicted esterase